MQLVAPTKVAIADKYTTYAYFLSLRKTCAITSFKSIIKTNTIKDVNIVNTNAVEQTVF